MEEQQENSGGCFSSCNQCGKATTGLFRVGDLWVCEQCRFWLETEEAEQVQAELQMCQDHGPYYRGGCH